MIEDCPDGARVYVSEVEKPGYWCSFSRTGGPTMSPKPRRFIISATLDQDAREHYRGIRLLIFASRGELSSIRRDIRISEATSGEKHSFNRSEPRCGLSCLRQREGLFRREQMAIVNASSSTEPNRKPLFTIAFEALAHSRSESMCLKWRSNHNLNAKESNGTLAIVFEASYSGQHTIFKVMNSNQFLVLSPPAPCLHVSRPMCRCGKARNELAPIYHLTISSCNPEARRRCPNLTPQILHKIAEYSAVGMMQDGQFWLKGLLNIALVAKSWTIAVDPFFKLHASVVCSQKPQLSGVASSLGYRPEKGKLMQGFSLWNYDLLPRKTPSAESILQRSLLKIAQTATRLRTVEIYPVDPALYEDYISALTKLEMLETCIVSTFFMDWRMGEDFPTFDDIQVMMSNWPALSSLTYTGSKPESDSPMSRALPTGGPHIRHNLRILRLTHVSVDCPRLLRFIDVDNPQLNHLSLSNVTCTNDDLLLFLRKIANCVEFIGFMNCIFPRDSTEEYALDIMVPELKALHSLSVEGEGVSWRSLARQTNRHPTLNALHFTAVKCNGFPAEKILEALEVTTWASIYLSNLDTITPELVARAEDLADTRNIRLNWYQWRQ